MFSQNSSESKTEKSPKKTKGHHAGSSNSIKSRLEEARTVTGEMDIISPATVSYLVTSSDYVFVSKATFKMAIQGDEITSISMLVKPDMDKTYVVSGSTIHKNNDGSVNYKKSTLVKPIIGIQDDFYVWGENIILHPPQIQGVGALDARASIGLGKQFTLPVEKRKALTPEVLKQFFGCDVATLSKFLTPLMDAKKSGSRTEEKAPLSAEKQLICGFGIEKCEIHLKARKRKLTPSEDSELAEANNTAKTKLEENEVTKKLNGVKTHRELSAEHAAASVRDNPSEDDQEEVHSSSLKKLLK